MVHTYFQINGSFEHETLYLLASTPISYKDNDFDLAQLFVLAVGMWLMRNNIVTELVQVTYEGIIGKSNH
jgi:hypothetical protein